MSRRATGSARYHRGRWQAGVTVAGVRTWHDCPAAVTTRAQARAYAAWLSEEMRSGRVVLDRAPPPVPPAPEGESFRSWSERWLKHRKSVRGLKSTGTDLSALRTHLWPALGEVPVTAITAEQVEVVRDELDAKVRGKVITWKTAINVWGVLTSAFRDAYRSKDKSLRVRTDNPARDMPGPDRGAKKAKQYLYPSEFLAFATCEAIPLRWRRLVALAVYTGLRAGELRALTWADVDIEHGVLSVTRAVNRKTGKVSTTKTGETRRVRIEPELVPLLEAMRGAAPAGEAVTWLPSHDDQATVFRYYLARTGAQRAGLLEGTETSLPIHFHDLRATAVTWWAVRGDEPLRIQRRAGHKSLATTQRYIREAENLGPGFGQVFPALPEALLRLEAAEVREPPPAVPGALQEAILERLRAVGHPMAPGELAAGLQRSPQRVWVAVQRLERRGLVVVEGETHGRRVRLPIDPANRSHAPDDPTKAG